jgi:hypothetical protein
MPRQDREAGESEAEGGGDMRKPKAFDSWPPAKQEEWRVKDRASQKAYRQTPKYKAYKQTPEYKAYQKAYHESPERKAYKKAYQQSPECKAKKKAYHESPEYKAYKKAYRQTPQYKACNKARQQTPERKAYKQTPEYKAGRKLYNKEYRQRIREDEAANLFFAMMKATEEISAINTQPNQTNDNDTNEPTSKD